MTSLVNTRTPPAAAPPAPRDRAIIGPDRGHRKRAGGAIWPGLLLTAAIAGAGFGLRRVPGLALFSPMILSIVIGIVVHNAVGTPLRAKAGVVFSLRRILRLAIVLLGLQLTAQQLIEVGVRGAGIIVVMLVTTFLFTIWLGRLIGVDRRLAELIAAGTSICGASAVIAANTVTRASDEDVAYAVACVTVFGSIAMLTYPLLPALLHLDPRAYGLWSGASIHEIAQVVAAAFQDGRQAGEYATVAKLTRVMMLAPTVIVLGLLAARRRADAEGAEARVRPPLPWFVLGFIGLMGVNSLIPMPSMVRGAVVPATTFLLSMALAAMGLETDLGKLAGRGVRPFLLGLAASLFIAGGSLALVRMAS